MLRPLSGRRGPWDAAASVRLGCALGDGLDNAATSAASVGDDIVPMFCAHFGHDHRINPGLALGPQLDERQTDARRHHVRPGPARI